MNRTAYLIAALLFVTAGFLISNKVRTGGGDTAIEVSRNLWRVTVVMNIKGEGARAKVRMTLPKDSPRQTIYNEHFENDEMTFYIRERPVSGNRIGFWRSEFLDGSKTLEYTFSAQLRGRTFAVAPEIVPWQPAQFYPPEFKTWIESSKLIQSDNTLVRRQLKTIIGRERRADRIMQKIYDFVRGEVKYKSEKGSKSAAQTLEKLVADCGGQARLFAAFSRAAGIPSRIVGGLIIQGGVKRITHVWVENYIGGEWIPFDVVNGHYATLPDDYLEMYRGDYALVKHIGLQKFDSFFMIGTEHIPPVDNPWSLYALPVHFQSMVKIILLIPVGALVVAFVRSVIGIPTFGTFTPVLLAIAFREISLWLGLGCVGMIVFFGWIFRSLLDRLKILVIPRLAMVVTMVTMMVLGIMIVGFHAGIHNILYISLFPFVIMTWLIERFSVTEIEDGVPTAIRTLFGTTLIAVAAYYLMEEHQLRAYLFAFPEFLLVIMGLLLLIGRYTGLRLTELWRFREMNRLNNEERPKAEGPE